MKISFLGASRFVTGSLYLLEAGGLNILVDCGLLQGSDEKKVGSEFTFRPSQIDYVLLTHAHIDHSGRLPKLVKDGFKGTIFATDATSSLASIMLLDSAHIQESEIEWKNRKLRRKGEKLEEPLYTKEDAYNALDLFQRVDYNKIQTLNGYVSFRFQDAGHLLGSASIEIFVTENNKTKKIVFSGDIGNLNQPIIKDPEYLDKADVVVMESTYGNRLHEVKGSDDIYKRALMLSQIVDETFKRGGKLIIPSFAVGRTQELLYMFRIIIDRKYLTYPFKVYLDSPLSIKATQVFKSQLGGNYFDKEARELINKGVNLVDFPSLIKIRDTSESVALNTIKESCVIISSSGMCEGGRIKHHLKHNLYDSKNTILFVGYQAEGTLGRSIVDGALHVTIFGEQIDVKAKITSLPGVSGHADKAGLIKWITNFKIKPDKVFITHGDENVAPAFAYELKEKYGFNAYAPKLNEVFDLSGIIPVQEKEEYIDQNSKALNAARDSLAINLERVDEVINRLNDQARKCNLEDNKRALRLTNAIKRLASDLEDLANKWSRDSK